MLAPVDKHEWWLRYVESQCWERGNLDQSSYFTFLRAGSLGVSPNEALQTIAARIRSAGDHPKPAKLNQQLRRAYAVAGSCEQTGEYHFRKEPRPVFLAEYAQKFAARAPGEVDEKWLRRKSPVPSPSGLTPAEFLFCVFDIGQQVLIFTDCRSQGQRLWQNHSFKVDREALNSFTRGHADGGWFLSNPVDGREHFNERQQSMSRRSEESITAFRHAVLESDCQPVDQWLKILVQLPLPIVSITSSGGKSLHALIRVDATSKSNWDQTVAAIKPRLVNLGADPGALTAVRLTRLANCYRGERFQELLYLNPKPSDEPIWKEESGGYRR
jgi:hypothetical protein